MVVEKCIPNLEQIHFKIYRQIMFWLCVVGGLLGSSTSMCLLQNTLKLGQIHFQRQIHFRRQISFISFWLCAMVGLSGSSSSMWLLGHNKVFAPSQGGPSPPSSVTSLDNSPHFKPGSTPGQLCSSRKQLLGHIWSLLSNVCPVVSKNSLLHHLFSCLMHFWFKTKTLCWCPPNRGNI